MKIILPIASLLFLCSPICAEDKPDNINTALESAAISFLKSAEVTGEKIANGISSAADYVMEEMPSVIQEFLRWHFVSSLTYFILGFVLLFNAWVALKYGLSPVCGKKWEKDHGGFTGDGLRAWLAIAISTFSGFCGVLSIFYNLAWLKIWLAPRVFLIEQFGYLLK